MKATKQFLLPSCEVSKEGGAKKIEIQQRDSMCISLINNHKTIERYSLVGWGIIF
jgi:hypothetical protein